MAMNNTMARLESDAVLTTIVCGWWARYSGEYLHTLLHGACIALAGQNNAIALELGFLWDLHETKMAMDKRGKRS